MPRYTGEFKDINSDRYVVVIQNENVPSSNVDLLLGETPVEINWNSEERFDSTNLSDCTITISTKTLLTDFFNPTANSVRVVVYKKSTGEVKFAGFVTPNTYNQGFARIYDELELNCIDAITTAQYLKVPDKYRTSDAVTFRSLLYEMLNTINGDYFSPGDIMCPISRMIVSDSRVSSNGSDADILDELYINPQNFFDDDDEKTPWYWLDVLKNICQYLGLQAVQVGDTLYLLDIDAHANGISPVWVHDAKQARSQFSTYNVYHAKDVMPTETIDLSKKGVSAGSEPNVTLDTVYNKICVKANRYASEDLIPEFFDEDKLVTDMTAPEQFAQYYVIKDKDYTKKVDGHYDLGSSWSTHYWYYVLYNNPNFTSQWWPRTDNGVVSSTSFNHPQNYRDCLTYMKSNYLGAQVIKVGHNEQQNGDNSKKAMSWEYALYCPVHGNNDDGTDTAPRYNDTTFRPIYTYTGESAVNLTPVEGETTYININGKVLFSKPLTFSGPAMLPLLGTIYKKIGDYGIVVKEESWPYEFHIPNTDQQEWKIEMMSNGSSDWESSGGHSNTDTMQNFPVFPARLKIGDKYWVCDWSHVDAQGYYTLDCHWSKTPGTFPITINPAIGDFVLGKKFDIENQFDPLDPVDAQGNKITITPEDHINGKVEFAIGAPYPSVYSHIYEYSHGWWFWERTHWDADVYQVLAHCDAIWLYDFEMKVNSSNRSLMTVDEDDYLYYNVPVEESYVEEWDEGEWKINTLTPAGVSLSTVMTKEGGEFVPVDEIYDKAFHYSTIAEKHFIRRMYANYSRPMIKYDTEVFLKAHKTRVENNGTSLFPVFFSKAMNMTFYPMSASVDLKAGKAEFHLRERVIDI